MRLVQRPEIREFLESLDTCGHFVWRDGRCDGCGLVSSRPQDEKPRPVPITWKAHWLREMRDAIAREDAAKAVKAGIRPTLLKLERLIDAARVEAPDGSYDDAAALVRQLKQSLRVF